MPAGTDPSPPVVARSPDRVSVVARSPDRATRPDRRSPLQPPRSHPLSLLRSEPTIVAMGRYRIHPEAAVYFLTYSVVEWLPVFIREATCKVVTDSLTFCHRQ